MRAQLLTLFLIFTKVTLAAIHAFTDNPGESPFWWTFTGTPVLDGQIFYAIVTETPPALPGLTQFYELENSINGDYLYTTSQAEFVFLRTSINAPRGWGDGTFDTLYIFGDNEPDTVPLYRFYNGQNHFFSTSYDEGINAGYGSEGIAGYVYLSANNGAIPIYRWHQDNYYFGP